MDVICILKRVRKAVIADSEEGYAAACVSFNIIITKNNSHLCPREML
jgi:hypothetical protein